MKNRYIISRKDICVSFLLRKKYLRFSYLGLFLFPNVKIIFLGTWNIEEKKIVALEKFFSNFYVCRTLKIDKIAKCNNKTSTKFSRIFKNKIQNFEKNPDFIFFTFFFIGIWKHLLWRRWSLRREIPWISR